MVYGKCNVLIFKGISTTYTTCLTDDRDVRMEGSSKSVKRKIEEVDAEASDEKSLGIKRFLRAPRQGRRFSSESGCLFRMVNIL